MPNRVLDQGLKDERGNEAIECSLVDLGMVMQPLSKTNLLNRQIALEQFEFVAQRDFMPRRLSQIGPKQIAQIGDHLLGQLRLGSDMTCNRVQSVQEEMGLELQAQHFEPCFRETAREFIRVTGFVARGSPHFQTMPQTGNGKVNQKVQGTTAGERDTKAFQCADRSQNASLRPVRGGRPRRLLQTDEKHDVISARLKTGHEENSGQRANEMRENHLRPCFVGPNTTHADENGQRGEQEQRHVLTRSEAQGTRHRDRLRHLRGEQEKLACKCDDQKRTDNEKEPGGPAPDARRNVRKQIHSLVQSVTWAGCRQGARDEPASGGDEFPLPVIQPFITAASGFITFPWRPAENISMNALMKRAYLRVAVGMALLLATYFVYCARRAAADRVTLRVRQADLVAVVRSIRWQTWESILILQGTEAKVTLDVKNVPLDEVLGMLAEQMNGDWTAFHALHTTGSVRTLRKALVTGKESAPGWPTLGRQLQLSPTAMFARDAAGLPGPVTLMVTNQPALEVADVLGRFAHTRILVDGEGLRPVSLRLLNMDFEEAIHLFAKAMNAKVNRFFLLQSHARRMAAPPPPDMTMAPLDDEVRAQLASGKSVMIPFGGPPGEAAPGWIPAPPADVSPETLRQEASRKMLESLRNSTPEQRAERWRSLQTLRPPGDTR